jgi:hypothetical protein
MRNAFTKYDITIICLAALSVSLCVVKMLSTFDYVMLSYAENKFVAETQ